MKNWFVITLFFSVVGYAQQTDYLLASSTFKMNFLDTNDQVVHETYLFEQLSEADSLCIIVNATLGKGVLNAFRNNELLTATPVDVLYRSVEYSVLVIGFGYDDRLRSKNPVGATVIRMDLTEQTLNFSYLTRGMTAFKDAMIVHL